MMLLHCALYTCVRLCGTVQGFSFTPCLLKALCALCKAFACISIIHANCIVGPVDSVDSVVSILAADQVRRRRRCPLGLQLLSPGAASGPTCHPGIPSNDDHVSSRIQLIHVEQHDHLPPSGLLTEATQEPRSSIRCGV